MAIQLLFVYEHGCNTKTKSRYYYSTKAVQMALRQLITNLKPIIIEMSKSNRHPIKYIGVLDTNNLTIFSTHRDDMTDYELWHSFSYKVENIPKYIKRLEV